MKDHRKPITRRPKQESRWKVSLYDSQPAEITEDNCLVKLSSGAASTETESNGSTPHPVKPPSDGSVI
jgi:hypothetical protein